jgi:hypothetical protein
LQNLVQNLEACFPHPQVFRLLFAFTQTVGDITPLAVINDNQSNVFWHTRFSSSKQSLLNLGDTTTFDISTLDPLDNGLTLFQAVQAQIAVNPTQALTLPSYLGFEGQWSDRTAPTGYLIPVQIATIGAGGANITMPLPLGSQNQVGPVLTCLDPSDPGCTTLTSLPSGPPSTNNDGQILIAIDQKVRLERQAFNATFGINALAPLTNVTASIAITDSSGHNVNGNFFVLLTSDTQGATKGGNITGLANIGRQLIPNAGVGGTQPQGIQYNVQVTMTYVRGGSLRPCRLKWSPSPSCRARSSQSAIRFRSSKCSANPPKSA